MAKNNIEKLRRQKRLTQEQLADIIGIGRDTMGRYEAEITDMKVSTLIALADYFNVTTDYVLGRTDKQFIDKRKVLDSLTETHTKLIAELCMEEKNNILLTGFIYCRPFLYFIFLKGPQYGPYNLRK